MHVRPVEENTDDSIRCNIDPDSNMIVFNDSQEEKHSEHKMPTDFGISICSNPDEENTFDSIRCNLDSDSNVTFFSERQ
jgi:hypothetical protein